MCTYLHPAEAPDRIRRILYFALRAVVAVVQPEAAEAGAAVHRLRQVRRKLCKT